MVQRGRQELQTQRSRRVVVKRMLQFLGSQDEHCETILHSLREARRLGVDMVPQSFFRYLFLSIHVFHWITIIQCHSLSFALSIYLPHSLIVIITDPSPQAFVDKVQRVYDSAGPRLKARNRLRTAVGQSLLPPHFSPTHPLTYWAGFP